MPTSKKPVIAVDLDDVLADENSAVMVFHNAAYGTNHTQEDYHTTEAPYWSFWDKVWQVDAKEAERRVKVYHGHKLTIELELIPGAVETIKKLQKWFKLVIVTSRGDKFVDYTQAWLEKHFPKVFTDIHFVPLWQADTKVTKAHICNEIGAQYLIDDAPEHCQLAAEVGIQSLLFGDYGWNRSVTLPKGVTRVKDWQAVWEYFDAHRG